MKRNSFEIISTRILEIMEAGTIPWRKPWKLVGNGQAPRNIVSGKVYQGSNLILLSCSGFTSPLWMTFKQAKKLGGNVKKGSNGWPVVYWKFLKKAEQQEDGSYKEKTIPMLRHYTVFNLDQTEGVKVPKKYTSDEEQIPEVEPIHCAELVIEHWTDKPTIINDKFSNSAFYMSGPDTITVPHISQYEQKEEYYSTLFHEAIHATGHSSRLNRKGTSSDYDGFGGENYSREELVAEIGAAMVCGHCDIEQATIENSAAYINGWMEKIKEDAKCFVIAAGQAEKAARYILNAQSEEE